MKNTFILIPPSEGKEVGGSEAPLSELTDHVQFMIDKLNHIENNWEKILSLKGKSLQRAIESNHSISSSTTLPAMQRYTGVMYNAIQYETLDQKSKDYFNKHVRIVSAVFGLVKPVDLIPDYKLKIDKLGADKHWKAVLGKILKDAFILDLLPKAHKKAVSYQDGLEVEFIISKNKKIVSAGHQGKFIKGRFIRWLAKKQCLDPKKFKNFKEDGFQWSGEKFIKTIA